VQIVKQKTSILADEVKDSVPKKLLYKERGNIAEWREIIV